MSSSSTRVTVVDVLRGFALLGMVAVHVGRLAHADSPADSAPWVAFTWLLQDKARTMFALLFGAGFALQLERARGRGVSGRGFATRYLWRMFILWSTFGLLCQSLFENSVLLQYAVFGAAILPLHRLRTRYLLAVVAASMMLPTVARIAADARPSAETAASTRGHQRRVEMAAAIHVAERERALTRVLVLKVRRELWRTTQWTTYVEYLDVLGVLLVGFLGVRHGVFTRPGEHRRPIGTVGVLGLILWAIDHSVPPGSTEIGLPLVNTSVDWLFQLQPDRWLALTYASTVLLVFSMAGPLGIRSRRLLSLAGPVGRMALTWFVVHQAIVMALFSAYGAGIDVPISAAHGWALFGTLVVAILVISNLWIRTFGQGPLERIWRGLSSGRPVTISGSGRKPVLSAAEA